MLAKVIIENGVKKIQALTADTGTGAPVGSLIAMYKKSSPSGYLYCDGSTFDETKYPALYQYLGSNVLPDYRECVAVGAEQNTTDTIASHDVYTEGQFKDDQLQSHLHVFYDGNSSTQANLRMGKFGSLIQPSAFNGALPVDNMKETTGARVGDTTHGKQKAVFIYIKATSGLTENQQENVLNTINENNSYSTEEHPTGKKWIDGKPIYRKVVNFGALPNTTTKSVAYNITNKDKFISIEGIATDGTNTMPIPRPSSSTNNILDVYCDTVNVVAKCTGNLSDYSAYITLEYTKTTD